jgi:ribonuclease VapC
MTLDSSAILAILFRERGFEALVSRLLTAQVRVVGTPTLVETGIVLAAKLNGGAAGMLSRFLQEFEVAAIPFGEPHWREACEAFLRFGRGRHPAGLNFGDCLSYATARLSGQPLLFVGRDFARTDIEAGYVGRV